MPRALRCAALRAKGDEHDPFEDPATLLQTELYSVAAFEKAPRPAQSR